MALAGRAPVFAYQPALDGVRALAVTAVLVFHAGVAALPGGFLGVDAFFVLSGFLITSLLLGEYRRDGRIRLGGFWLRRARRLLPALLLLVAFVAIAFRGVLTTLDLRLLRDDALAALGYVANWRMIYRGDDYFTQTAAPSPLQHTWSLGIEEQFYVLWPLIVVVVLWVGARSRRLLFWLCVAGAAASAVACAVLYDPFDVNRAYFGTDARAQALLIGCALAALLAGGGRAKAQPRRRDGPPGRPGGAGGPGCWRRPQEPAWWSWRCCGPARTAWTRSSTGAASLSAGSPWRPCWPTACCGPRHPWPGRWPSPRWCGWERSPTGCTCGTGRCSR